MARAKVAKITLTGVTPGTFDVTIGNDVSERHRRCGLLHTLGVPLPITVCGPPGPLSRRLPAMI